MSLLLWALLAWNVSLTMHAIGHGHKIGYRPMRMVGRVRRRGQHGDPL